MDYFYRLSNKVGRTKTILEILEDKINIHHGKIKVFFQELLYDVNINHGESIIISEPSYLQEKIDYYENNFSSILTNSFKKYILNVFFYKNYDKWKAYELALSISINVCPYCNRQYTFTLGNDKNKSVRPQFDHFYSKDKYPYLSLSFYNLIPCCSNCNTSLKGANEFSFKENINPYIEFFGEDAKFSIKPNNIGFIDGVAESYEISCKISDQITPEKEIKCKNNIEIFKINELYNYHKDYVDELIAKNRIITKEYINQLYDQFHGVYFSNLNDLYRILLGNYILEEDLEKRVLAKLTKDISEELGMFPF